MSRKVPKVRFRPKECPHCAFYIDDYERQCSNSLNAFNSRYGVLIGSTDRNCLDFQPKLAFFNENNKRLI